MQMPAADVVTRAVERLLEMARMRYAAGGTAPYFACCGKSSAACYRD